MNPDYLINTMDEAAAGTHEMFMSYVRAGFTEDQALKLVMHNLRVAHECPDHTDLE